MAPLAGWPSVEQQRSTGGSSDRHELRTRESSPQTIFQAAMNAQLRASNQPAEALLYTTANGQPYASPYGAQRVGPNGPLLLQDTHLIDNQAHFNRKNIPDRVVHALGDGRLLMLIACPLTPTSPVGQTTPITMRFSNAAGAKGSQDTSRSVRGFAVKFRTPQGNWDLLLNNSPIFFEWWLPGHLAEMKHGWLKTNAYSGHVYKWVKEDGSWVYVKITLKSSQGVANYTAAEQADVGNPGQASQEMFESIQAGKRPGWKVYAQVMTPQEAEEFRYNVLDLTKEWREDVVPLHEIGKIELTQNPTNYFAEVEQAAFAPGNIIDGWEPSDDPVLQMRLFAYTDAQRYRLGANFQQIPVNCPFSAVANYQRNGASSYLGNQGSRPAFDASYSHLVVVPRAYSTDNHTIWKSGAIRYLSEISDIDFEQPRYFYTSLSGDQKKNLVANFAGGLSQVQNPNVVRTVLRVVQRASPELAQRIHSAIEADSSSSRL
ncbi:uncharacterized protein VP01_910g9 [Puccinia sorghi]|uniref:Catalase core domain-containing protein n=1 Tax=Puccinia sorghi TaxID=27349 RepID=A0A0L6U9P8_9BASI|nr:uncharacterized protein VP01_910g9 [Puccinia sorghi]